MAVPRLDPAAVGTIDQAGAFLQQQFHDLGIVRAIQPWEFAYIEGEARRRFRDFDGSRVTGAIVNWVLDEMEPYVAGLLAERPFADAPQAITPPRPFLYDAVLPWTPPPDDRDFLRADLWGVRVPGLPAIRRGSSRYPESGLTYLLHDYAPEWRQRIYMAHRQRGYTHFYLSWPDARDAAGFSIAQFVALCAEVKAAGFYVGVFLAAKGRYAGNDIDGDPFRITPDDYQDRVGPVLAELLNAQAVDELVPAWEMDLFIADGAPCLEICRWVGTAAHHKELTCWLHCSTHVTSWYQDGDSRGRFGFWDDLGDTVDGLNYQAHSNWDPAELQGRMMDTLLQFEQQGNRHKLRAFELKASAQFDQESIAAERVGQITGWLACCTGGPKSGGTSARVWGSGNGLISPYTGGPV